MMLLMFSHVYDGEGRLCYVQLRRHPNVLNVRNALNILNEWTLLNIKIPNMDREIPHGLFAFDALAL